MEKIILLCILIPVAAFFTGLGIFAWKRKKPMWFWSGAEVSEKEISDIPAYNRANGIMWIVFSCVFWVSAILGFRYPGTAEIILAVGCVGGIPILIVVYRRIYARYGIRDRTEDPGRK